MAVLFLWLALSLLCRNERTRSGDESEVKILDLQGFELFAFGIEHRFWYCDNTRLYAEGSEGLDVTTLLVKATKSLLCGCNS